MTEEDTNDWIKRHEANMNAPHVFAVSLTHAKELSETLTNSNKEYFKTLFKKTTGKVRRDEKNKILKYERCSYPFPHLNPKYKKY